MGKKAKKFGFWLRRRSHLPFMVVGSVIVVALFFNEDTSMQLNVRYDRQISELKEQIRQNRDSAAFYRRRRESIQAGESDLEKIAREQYHMQRPTEDVFLLREKGR